MRHYTGDDDDDFDGDEGSSVGGAGELSGGFTDWPSLRQNPGHWAGTLKRNQSKAKSVGGPTNVEGQDEIRWGDRVRRTMVVPNAVGPGLVGGFDPNNFTQFVQIVRPARVWSLMYNLEWTNPVAAPLVAGERIVAFFSIYLGVGSSRIRIGRDVDIVGPTGVPVFPQFGIDSTFVDPNLVAKEIIISVNVALEAGAPTVGARTFELLLSAHGAPVTR